MSSAGRPRRLWIRILVTACACFLLAAALAALAWAEPPPDMRGVLNVVLALAFAMAGVYTLQWARRLRRDEAG